MNHILLTSRRPSAPLYNCKQEYTRRYGEAACGPDERWKLAALLRFVQAEEPALTDPRGAPRCAAPCRAACLGMPRCAAQLRRTLAWPPLTARPPLPAGLHPGAPRRPLGPDAPPASPASTTAAPAAMSEAMRKLRQKLYKLANEEKRRAADGRP